MRNAASLLALLTAVVPALTARAISEAQTKSTCDQFGTVQVGPYTVNPDKWGKAAGSGTQCAQIDHLNGDKLAWSTTWSWTNNPDNVKSYANIISSKIPCKELKNYKNIPTTWDWHAHEIEVMVWLGTYGGLLPIGAPNPVSTPTIGNTHFKLYKGYSSDAGTTTYSFVSEHSVNKYKGDLMTFFNPLVHNQGVSAGLFLQEVHAGTEAVTGQGVKFTTTGYTISSN